MPEGIAARARFLIPRRHLRPQGRGGIIRRREWRVGGGGWPAPHSPALRPSARRSQEWSVQ